jgi:TP901 family phage tail tape measure protein
MPLELEAVVVGLEASIQRAMNIAGKNAKIDLGTSSKAIDSISQPLGRITGQADQFGKSMEAANARVLAFGASVGILGTITRGFQEMISVTIQVEKSLANINSVMGASSAQLNKFKNDIFSIAKETGNSFQTVSEAALELSRQGLKSDEVLRRLKDSMVLSRLSGMDAANAVEGLTAAVNSFSKSGITTTEVLNKIAKTAAAYSVSEKDLIEGFKRSASVAQQAGVSLDELGGIITAVQEKTARGGAVIGNAFKTIFTRIQRPDSLAALQEVGAAVTDMQGGILPATKLIENLAQKMNSLSDIQKANITEKIGGGFQIGPLLAALDDLTGKTSTYMGATQAMASAGNEAYARNTALNKTLAASINEATVNLQELANTLGEIGVTDSLKNILSFFSSLTTNIKDLLQGEGIGSDLANGIIKGLSGIITGPGFVIFGAIIAKLTYGLVAFGAESLKAFFGIGQAQKEINALASSLTNTLMTNQNIHKAVLSLEGNHVAQATLLGNILKQNNAEMQRFVEMGKRLAPGAAAVFKAGGGSPVKTSAEGYMPAVAQESFDIKRGVGGANSSNKPVVIPNFAFGGGKVGTMVANDSEYVVNNYGGSGGSAIFNKDMVSKIGLPSGAQKINSAGGFIPNFVDIKKLSAQQIGSRINLDPSDPKYISREDARNAGYKTTAEKNAEKALNKEKSFESLARLNAGGKDFGMIVGERGVGTSESRYADNEGRITETRTNSSKYLIDVPIFRVNDKNLKFKSTDKLTSQLSKVSASAALKMAKDLSGNVLPEPANIELIQSLLNKGSLTATAGAIFEAGIAGILKDDDFKDFKAQDRNSLIDFRTNPQLRELFGVTGGQAGKGLEAKANAGPDLISSTAGKILKINGYGDKKPQPAFGRSASGYIPNFVDPLKEAISREIGTGLDPSQVYIDQNSSLKNSGNPMGLMVANRRDEPAGGWQGINRARKEGADITAYGAAGGFIPNFAGFKGQNPKYRPSTNSSNNDGSSTEPISSAADKAAASLDKVADSADQTNKGQKDNLGTIFAVQLAMSGLSAATAGSSSEIAKYTNIVSDGLSSGTTAVFALQGLAAAIPKFAGFLGPAGIAIGGLAAAWQIGTGIYNEVNGINKSVAKSLATVGDAASKASINLSGLSKDRQEEVKKTAESIISEGMKTETTKMVNLLAAQGGKGGSVGMRSGPAVVASTVSATIVDDISGKLKQSLKDITTEANAAGVSTSELQNRIRAFSGDTKLTKEEIEALSLQFAGLIDNLSAGDLAIKRMTSPSTDLGKSIGGLTREQFTQKAKNIDDESFKPLRDEMAKGGKTDPKAQFDVLKQLWAELSSRSKQTQSELSQGVDNLNIKYKELLTTLKAQSLYRTMIDDLEDEALNKQADLLSIAKDLTLTDTDRQRAIENANNENEKAISIIKNQSSAVEGLGGSLKESMKSAVIDPKQFNTIFQKITDGAANAQEELKIAFENVDTAKIEEIVDRIGASLNLPKQQAEAANAAILEYVTLLDKGKIKIDQENAAKMAGQKIQRDVNDLQREQNNLFEKAKTLSDSILAKKSLQNIVLEGESQRIDIKKQIELKQPATFAGMYDSASILAKREQIEKKYFDLKQKNDLDRELNQIAIEARKNAFTEKNILALGQNETAVKDNVDATKALTEQLKQNTSLPTTATSTAGNKTDLEKNLSEPLKKYAASFQSSGEKYGVNPKFLAAASEFETGRGTSQAFRLGNNAMGISDQYGVKKQSTVEDSIDKIAKTLTSLSGPYKNASTIAQIGPIYSPVGAKNDPRNTNKDWIPSVSSIYKNQFGGNPMENVKSVFTTGDKYGTDILSSGSTIAGLNISPEKKNAEARAAAIKLGAKTEEAIDSTVNQIMSVANQIEAATAKNKERGLTEEEAKALRSLESRPRTFGEGFGQGMTNLNKQVEDFAGNIGERIPQMFADNMATAMEAIIMKGGDLKDTLRSAATSFLNEMTKASISQLANSTTSMFQQAGSSLFKGYASGGRITGGSGTKDDVPSMLMGGEFVMNKKAVQKYGNKFMEKLNNGTLSHFASGGAVGDLDKYKISSGGLGSPSQTTSSSPMQTGQGGFYMPGYYGEGTISGKNNLLSYASQAYTSGAKDVITSGTNFAGISLEGESVALTNFGRTQGPMAQAIAESKGQSLDLYVQQMEQEAAIEKARKDAIKERQKALKTALISAVVMAGVSVVGSAASSGYNAASAAAKADGATGMGQVGAGLKGIFSGGNIGGGIQAGGLKNLFTGNIGLSQVGSLKDYQNYLSNNPKIAQQILGSSDYKNISGPSGSLDINRLGPNNTLGLNNTLGQNNILGPDNMPTQGLPLPEGDTDYNYSVLPKKATGGSIPQRSGIDTVPTMLSGGEFIMNAGAAQRIGPANLNAMNSGTSDTGKDSKELNDKLISKLDELIAASKESGKGVTVNVASNGKEETKSEGSSEQDKNLSRKIKEAVIKVIQEEKRLGGVLRRS